MINSEQSENLIHFWGWTICFLKSEFYWRRKIWKESKVKKWRRKIRRKKYKEVVKKTSPGLLHEEKGQTECYCSKRDNLEVWAVFPLANLALIPFNELTMRCKTGSFWFRVNIVKNVNNDKKYFCKLFCRIFFLDNSFKMYENDEMQDVFLDDHCHQSIIEIMIFQKFSFFIK